MKRTLIAGALLGLLLATGLIGYYGAPTIFQAAASVGWGLVIVVFVRGVMIVGDGLAWRCLLPRSVPRPPLVFIGLRLIRESINGLLPAAQVGGDVAGARLLTFYGIGASLAAASVVVDVVLLVFTQFAFTVVGFGALVAIGADPTLVHWTGVGLLATALALGAFLLAQRFGLFLLVERVLLDVADRWRWPSLGGLANLHAAVQSIYRGKRGVLAASALHLAAWFVGAAEIWVALYFMGYPVGVIEALMLESLVQAVRGVVFPVPGALGAQEGGFVVLGALVGLGPEIALALSLVKRVPDLVFGLPGLLAWQVMEGRRLLFEPEED
jgi:glycosyltransferase 2 family protein